MRKSTPLFLSTFFLFACGGSDSSSNDDSPTPSQQITLDSSYEEVLSLGKNINSELSVELGGSPKTLYVLLTNHNSTDTSSPTIEHNQKVLKLAKKEILSSDVYQSRIHNQVPAHIKGFNQNSRHLFDNESSSTPVKKIIEPNNKAIEGDTEMFYYGMSDLNSSYNSTNATARKVVADISTVFGDKTLNFWVSDDSFDSGSGCLKANCVTQSMVDDLANKFLKEGSSNDTYDWVSNIFGEEWGSHNISNLIPNNNEISILLTDIDNDNSTNQGVIGYFYAKDNYLKSTVIDREGTTLSGSNERIMFYVDSVMFSNTENSDYWKKIIYATLAHEFTHMIEFYQKDVLKDKTSDTWLAEMTAEATEYVTSNRVQHDSPRGVSYDIGHAGDPANNKDRYPDFNLYNNTFSLTSFNSTIQEYSKVSAFGTFLVNNYGGASVLRDIMHSSQVSEQAVVDAVNSYKGVGSDISFGELIRDWGVAVLLSDRDDLQIGTPTYNTGDFTTTTYNGTDYQVGSINFFNYLKGNGSTDPNDTGPTISSTVGTVQPHGNYFYKVGDNLSGAVTVTIKTDSNTEATLISK